MNTKILLTVLLLLFLLASGVFLVINTGRDHTADETRAGSEPVENETSRAAPPAMGAGKKVVAYYFHTTKRCQTCRTFERYTTELMKADFARQIDSGALEFLLVNVDEDANRHFIDDYRLTTKSVIVAEFRGGELTRWKNLDRIWSLVDDKQAFMDYVRGGIMEYLGDSAHD